MHISINKLFDRNYMNKNLSLSFSQNQQEKKNYIEPTKLQNLQNIFRRKISH